MQSITCQPGYSQYSFEVIGPVRKPLVTTHQWTGITATVLANAARVTNPTAQYLVTLQGFFETLDTYVDVYPEFADLGRERHFLETK